MVQFAKKLLILGPPEIHAVYGARIEVNTARNSDVSCLETP